MGVIDRSGKPVIPIAAHTVGVRSSSSAEAAWFVVREGGKTGFMDDAGKWVIWPEYEAARSFQEGLSASMMGGLWGYADVKGRIAIAAGFQEAWPFSGGLGRVKKDGYYAYIDREGKIMRQW